MKLSDKHKEIAVTSAKAVKKNISFTLLAVSFVLIVGVGLLEVLEKVKSTGPFMELFLTCCGLYFGRRYVKSKNNEESKED